MKKHLLSLIFTLALLIPVGLMAQSGETAKGKRGGYLASGDQKLFFEIVDDGTKISFYPCDKEGNMLKVVPTEANVTIAFLSSTEVFNLQGVQLQDGAFTVVPTRTYPVYIYSLSYTYNDQQGAVKFRNPDSPQPR